MLSDNYERLSAVGSGATIRVDIPWDFENNTELNCYIKSVSGEYKFQSLGEITIDVDIDKLYVNVENTFTPNNATAYVARVTPASQTYELINGHALDPAALEAALDKAIKLIQELQEARPEGEQGYITSIDPFIIISALLRKETLIYFDSDGNPTFIHPSLLPGYYELKVSDNDTTPGYLEDKVDSGQFETLNEAANEYISVKDAGLTIAKVNGLQDALDALTNAIGDINTDIAFLSGQIDINTTNIDFLSGQIDINNNLLSQEGSYIQYFTNADLINGTLPVIHSLSASTVGVTVYDNENKYIIPDEIIDNPLELDRISVNLSSYTPIPDVWRVLCLKGGHSNNRVASVRDSFTNSDLTSGLIEGNVEWYLDIFHDLDEQFVIHTIANEVNEQIDPDLVSFTNSDNSRVYLTSFVPISGTWNYYVESGDGVGSVGSGGSGGSVSGDFLPRVLEYNDQRALAGSYIVNANDAGKMIIVDDGIIIPAGLPDGFQCAIAQAATVKKAFDIDASYTTKIGNPQAFISSDALVTIGIVNSTTIITTGQTEV